MRFSDLLVRATTRVGSPACVGLDPVLEKLPPEVRAIHTQPVVAIEAFCRGVLEAIQGVVGVVKPQSACFERYGAPGVGVLETICRQAREMGFVVILDAKRGDIDVTNEHYAAGVAHTGAHAVTLSPYLGLGCVRPFLDRGLGVFVLVRTSNPDGDRIQRLGASGDQTVATHIARQLAIEGAKHCGAIGWSDVGAVVGAPSDPDRQREGRILRSLMPDQVFLVPGVGAQGGGAEDVAALDAGRGGVIVNSSRSVLYPVGQLGPGWQARVSHAAKEFAQSVQPYLFTVNDRSGS